MRKIWLMVLALWLGTLVVSAQNDSLATSNSNTTFTISPETEKMFVKLLPHRDSTFSFAANPKDNFIKRISFHFNMLEWAMTLPNMGIEFDLNKTKKNNRSLLIWGKLNGNTKHNVHPQINFNVASARLEFRKYWRTGDVGKDGEGNSYQKIVLKRGKRLTRTVYDVEEFDSIPRQEEYYASEADSVIDSKYNGDPNRGWLYNKYHQIRRNITSTRTLRNPRNWRAYYLGAYAEADRFNVCFNKKGKQGQSVSAGLTVGWSIPILTRKFPNEGGLDLDLGALIGVRAAKYDAYNFDPESYCYAYDKEKSKPSWSISPIPLQELRVAFVYRFRSISNKVSLSLVDDYGKNWIKGFEDRRDSIKTALDDNQKAQREADTKRRAEERVAADSTSFWNNWHKRRLENARILNPDTIFVGEDATLARELLKPIETANNKVTKTKEKKSSKKPKRKPEDEKEQAEALKPETDEK